MRIRNLVLAVFASVAMAVGGSAVNAKAAPLPAPQTTCEYVGILESHFLLVRTWQDVPDGRIWWIHGSMHGKLACAVKRADVQINIQRGVRAWNKTRTIWHWVWITRETKWAKLDNKPAGYVFLLQTKVSCTGKTNWRVRFWGSPGVLQDGTTIKSTTIYYPRKNGEYENCEG